MRFIRGLIFSLLFYGMTAVMAIIGLPLLPLLAFLREAGIAPQ